MRGRKGVKKGLDSIINGILLVAILLSMCLAVGCNSDEFQEDIEVDDVDPQITCPEDITITIGATDVDPVVEYDAPLGTDNNESTTRQSQGLASGSTFPEGVTTNTFIVRDAFGNTASCSFDVTVVREAADQPVEPTVIGGLTVQGKKWSLVDELSDEFNDNSFDDSKWINTDPNRWIGRPPGLFMENTVSEAEGNLQLTAYLLDEPQTVNDQVFTHAGSNIYSVNDANVGVYAEARMKASQTFMSSTFWLINNRGAGTGCDVRVTELDIQECVGEVTGTGSFAQGFDQSIHSNTHSRQTACTETPVGSQGDDAPTEEKVYEDYHVYGCWWKSPNEIEVYLDGTFVYSISPPADFNLPMALRMVVETYNWNPPPQGGGMSGSEEQRTTYYDWVRVWELEDE
ncbi:MAG: HYR domain-containing protein [Bacteroidota bacterium]